MSLQLDLIQVPDSRADNARALQWQQGQCSADGCAQRADRLCDHTFKHTDGLQCDAPLCSGHAVRVDGRTYCDAHAPVQSRVALEMERERLLTDLDNWESGRFATHPGTPASGRVYRLSLQTAKKSLYDRLDRVNRWLGRPMYEGADRHAPVVALWP